MRTLFINIYKDEVTNTPDIEVFNAGKDNILDGFYISLGMAIAEGVNINEFKSLVTGFESANPIVFETFKQQWEKLKNILLSDNPIGYFDFDLSSEYLEWLKMNASTVFYQKYQGQHQVTVKLDIEELYKDTIGAICRRVLRFLHDKDNYKKFDGFLFNEKIINQDSKPVCSILKSFGNLNFISYSDCKKKNNVKDWSNLFPFCEVTLGKTTLEEIKQIGFFDIEKFKGKDYCFFLNETIVFSKEERETSFAELSLSHLDYRMSKHDFPTYWHDILGITWDMNIDDCRDSLLKQNAHRVTYYGYISPDEKYILVLIENNEEKLSSLYITINECPHCHSNKIEFYIEDGKLFIRCKECNHLRVTKH